LSSGYLDNPIAANIGMPISAANTDQKNILIDGHGNTAADDYK
jgi:hypothetical protein